MTRNLKALGLALFAMLAMGAVVAAGAQANGFVWGTNTKVLETEEDPDDFSQLFTTTASNLTCNEVSSTITRGGTTTEAVNTLKTENFKYDNNGTGKCVGTGGLEPKVEMNGCEYVYHAGATVTGGIEMTTDIVCEGGSSGIVINAGFLCKLTIPPQEGLGGITATNKNTTGKEEVTIEKTIEKIKYSHTGLCGNGSAENGIYHGKATIKGYTSNTLQTQSDFTVT